MLGRCLRRLAMKYKEILELQKGKLYNISISNVYITNANITK